MTSLGIEARIWPAPVEVVTAVPFPEQTGPCTYVPAVAETM